MTDIGTEWGTWIIIIGVAETGQLLFSVGFLLTALRIKKIITAQRKAAREAAKEKEVKDDGNAGT